MDAYDILKSIVAEQGYKPFARQLGVKNWQTVQKWIDKRRVPPEWVYKVINTTGGKVDAHSLRPDVFPSSRQAA